MKLLKSIHKLQWCNHWSLIISHFRNVITYPCWDKVYPWTLVKGAPGDMSHCEYLDKIWPQDTESALFYRLSICCGWIYNAILNMIQKEDYEVTKDTPYLALMGDLWGIISEFFGERFYEISRVLCIYMEVTLQTQDKSWESSNMCPADLLR